MTWSDRLFGILILGSLLAILLLIGFGAYEHSKKERINALAQEAVTNIGTYLQLKTVSHDGHKFVVGMTGWKDGGVSIIHHPACECMKR